MAKFCGKCGAKLDETTGLCPNCDAEKIKEQEKTAASASDKLGSIRNQEDMCSTDEKTQKKEAKKRIKKQKSSKESG